MEVFQDMKKIKKNLKRLKDTFEKKGKSKAKDFIVDDYAKEQEQFVAPNSVSIAQAYFARERAWFRAIYADETPVGFLMLEDNPYKSEYFLWRLMIDGRFQRMGFGRRALALLIAHVVFYSRIR